MIEGMIEVEIKVPLSSDAFSHIQESITKLGGIHLYSETQRDFYYDHPCRSFQETDEALRVRKSIAITSKEEKSVYAPFELVYKGPKLDTKSKTRHELSISISDVSSANAILEELGFRSIATISKKRTSFKHGLTTICLDEVDDVGFFMELERVVPIEEDLELIRDQLFEILKHLGIEAKTAIRTSYLELYLEKRNQ
jgi:adenylate cyclase class 2